MDLGRRVYRLGDIEIDISQGCLKRDGHDQYLRQQSFDVLVYLLERHSRLVEKDELIETIWQHTAVTDNALAQCIVEIRKALGDDPHQPRFIKTFPKHGYRFIGPVEERWVSEPVFDAPASGGNGSSQLSSSSVRPGTQVVPQAGKPWLPRVAVAGSVAIVLILWAAAWIWSRVQGAEITLPQLPGKKALAVMYFENQSARADLDWLREGLADMLITDLARSDQLTVLSRQQLYLLLERIGHKPGERIRLDEALDIARRTHADAFVLGSFAVVGQRVRVDVQLHESRQGQLLAADRIIVESPAQILTQADVVSLKLGSHLGVNPLDRGKETSLAEVMTDNLEAYRYYSLGVEKAQAFQNSQAVKLLQKAIDLDPRFAMAYAQIGFAYAVADFMPEKGKPYLEKAFQLSSRLSTKDRLYITGWDAIARADYPLAVRTFEQIVARYPLETEAYRRLGRLLLGEEQPEKALEVLRRGIAVDPESKGLYNAMGVVLLTLGRHDEAIAALQRSVALAPAEPNPHDSLGMAYQRGGRYDEAMAEYKSALALDPEFEPAIIHLGDVFFQQGRYRDAIHHYQRYIQVTDSDLARALGYGNIAQIYLGKRDLRRAQEAAAREMRYQRGAVWHSLLIALEENNRPAVDRLQRELFAHLPNPERGARQALRSQAYFRGYLELKSGNAAAAIAHFKEAVQHFPPTSGIELHEDCLADAYLESGQLDDAIREYQRILNLNPKYPLVQYHLAQAYKRKGEHERARAAYQQFMQIWAGADADLPEVVAARKDLQAANSAARRTSPARNSRDKA